MAYRSTWLNFVPQVMDIVPKYLGMMGSYGFQNAVPGQPRHIQLAPTRPMPPGVDAMTQAAPEAPQAPQAPQLTPDQMQQTKAETENMRIVAANIQAKKKLAEAKDGLEQDGQTPVPTRPARPPGWEEDVKRAAMLLGSGPGRFLERTGRQYAEDPLEYERRWKEKYPAEGTFIGSKYYSPEDLNRRNMARVLIGLDSGRYTPEKAARAAYLHRLGGEEATYPQYLQYYEEQLPFEQQLRRQAMRTRAAYLQEHPEQFFGQQASETPPPEIPGLEQIGGSWKDPETGITYRYGQPKPPQTPEQELEYWTQQWRRLFDPYFGEVIQGYEAEAEQIRQKIQNLILNMQITQQPGYSGAGTDNVINFPNGRRGRLIPVPGGEPEIEMLD